MAVAIRTLTTDDVATARQIVRRFHSKTISDGHLASVLGGTGNMLLVAEDAAGLLGFLFAHWIDRLPSEGCQLFIYEVEVAHEHRRTGVAFALLTTALAYARQRNAPSFVFTNHSNPAAAALYRKAGGLVKNGDDLLFVFS
jgi:ribosomal protein S18 acetylase RimI-like enzyme